MSTKIANKYIIDCVKYISIIVCRAHWVSISTDACVIYTFNLSHSCDLDD